MGDGCMRYFSGISIVSQLAIIEEFHFSISLITSFVKFNFNCKFISGIDFIFYMNKDGYKTKILMMQGF